MVPTSAHALDLGFSRFKFVCKGTPPVPLHPYLNLTLILAGAKALRKVPMISPSPSFPKKEVLVFLNHLCLWFFPFFIVLELAHLQDHPQQVGTIHKSGDFVIKGMANKGIHDINFFFLFTILFISHIVTAWFSFLRYVVVACISLLIIIRSSLLCMWGFFTHFYYVVTCKIYLSIWVFEKLLLIRGLIAWFAKVWNSWFN